MCGPEAQTFGAFVDFTVASVRLDYLNGFRRQRHQSKEVFAIHGQLELANGRCVVWNPRAEYVEGILQMNMWRRGTQAR